MSLSLIDTSNLVTFPENPTNGDMIKTLFPNHDETVHEYLGFINGVDLIINITKHECFKMWFPSSWWNAPYNESNEYE